MDDDGGFEFTLEGLLIGGLIGLLFGSQQKTARAAEAEAARRAWVEQDVIDRGAAASRAAQQYGLTPDLAADIGHAEDILEIRRERVTSRALARDLRHLRDAGRWVSFLLWTALWTAIGFVPVAFVTDVYLLDQIGMSVAGRTGWWLLAAGAWPAVPALMVAIHLDGRARQRIPDHVRSRLHRHGPRWHAHHGASRLHRHPGDPDGPAVAA